MNTIQLDSTYKVPGTSTKLLALLDNTAVSMDAMVDFIQLAALGIFSKVVSLICSYLPNKRSFGTQTATHALIITRVAPKASSGSKSAAEKYRHMNNATDERRGFRLQDIK